MEYTQTILFPSRVFFSLFFFHYTRLDLPSEESLSQSWVHCRFQHSHCYGSYHKTTSKCHSDLWFTNLWKPPSSRNLLLLLRSYSGMIRFFTVLQNSLDLLLSSSSTKNYFLKTGVSQPQETSQKSKKLYKNRNLKLAEFSPLKHGESLVSAWCKMPCSLRHFWVLIPRSPSRAAVWENHLLLLQPLSFSECSIRFSLWNYKSTCFSPDRAVGAALVLLRDKPLTCAKSSVNRSLRLQGHWIIAGDSLRTRTDLLLSV